MEKTYNEWNFIDEFLSEQRANVILKEIFKCDLELEQLPIENSSIDVVVMLAVIEHLLNYEHVIQEVYRILRVSWVFYLTSPAPYRY